MLFCLYAAASYICTIQRERKINRERILGEKEKKVREILQSSSTIAATISWAKKGRKILLKRGSELPCPT